AGLGGLRAGLLLLLLALLVLSLVLGLLLLLLLLLLAPLVASLLLLLLLLLLLALGLLDQAVEVLPGPLLDDLGRPAGILPERQALPAARHPVTDHGGIARVTGPAGIIAEQVVEKLAILHGAFAGFFRQRIVRIRLRPELDLAAAVLP